MIGLGKMGFNLVKNLQEKGHQVVAYDTDQQVRQSATEIGSQVVGNIEQLVAALAVEETVIVWTMVPAGVATEAVFTALLGQLPSGAIVIDGGNSNYQESVRRAATLAEQGVY